MHEAGLVELEQMLEEKEQELIEKDKQREKLREDMQAEVEARDQEIASLHDQIHDWSEAYNEKAQELLEMAD